MIRSKRRSAKRSIVAVLLAASLVSMLGGSAGAVSPLPITCTAAGTVLTTTGQPDTWTVSGTGSCGGDLEGTYIVQFSGLGTSQGLGLCAPEPVPFLVLDLNIGIVGTLTHAATGATKPLLQHWVAPVTTYPLGTPFAVTNATNTSVIGAGSFFNHIFLNCNGSPVAQFTWSFLT